MNLGLDEEKIVRAADEITESRVLDQLFVVLDAPNRWRRKIIKWIFLK